MQGIATKGEALAALLRQPRATPPGGDWAVVVTPADPEDTRGSHAG